MTKPLAALALGLAGLLMLAGLGVPARGETGPCRPDQHDGLVCGEGDGAARVIEGTISPSKRLAVAWRNPSGPVTEMPNDDIETVLIRLADGAVLATLKGDYWETTDGGHANRRYEFAAWSRDSRLVIETSADRWDTNVIDLHALGPDDKIVGSVDLLKAVSPAARAFLKQRRKKVDTESLSFMLDGAKTIAIDNNRRIVMVAQLYVPKSEPEIELRIAMQISGEGRTLTARIVSIERHRPRP